MKRLLYNMINEEPTVAMCNAVSFSQEALAAGAPKQLRVPYADTPYNRDGIVGVQRLNKQIAEQMVRYMAIFDPENKGVPGYIGHPDYASTPMAEDDFLRKEPGAVVWVHGVEAGEDALLLNVEWTPEGETLVTSRKFRFFSPFFLCEDLGTESGVRVYAPRLIKSLGLTNNPNWKMPPMINSKTVNNNPNGGANEGGNMNELMKKLQALLNSGVALTEATALVELEALINAIAGLRKHVVALANGKTYSTDGKGLSEMLADVLADCVNSKASVATLTTERDQAKSALALLQKSVATAAVNAAVAKGSVLQEHFQTKLDELLNAADFAKSIDCINALPKLMKTEETEGKKATERNAKITERRDKVEGLVNSAMKDGLSYDAAFAKVRREQPELFETIK